MLFWFEYLIYYITTHYISISCISLHALPYTLSGNVLVFFSWCCLGYGYMVVVSVLVMVYGIWWDNDNGRGDVMLMMAVSMSMSMSMLPRMLPNLMSFPMLGLEYLLGFPDQICTKLEILCDFRDEEISFCCTQKKGLVINAIGILYIVFKILITRDPIDTNAHAYHFLWTFEQCHGSMETGDFSNLWGCEGWQPWILRARLCAWLSQREAVMCFWCLQGLPSSLKSKIYTPK